MGFLRLFLGLLRENRRRYLDMALGSAAVVAGPVFLLSFLLGLWLLLSVLAEGVR